MHVLIAKCRPDFWYFMMDPEQGRLGRVNRFSAIHNPSPGQMQPTASFFTITTKILKTIRAAIECSLRVPNAATIFRLNGVDDECTRAAALFN